MAAIARTPARRSVPDPWLKPGIFIGALFPLASLGIRWFDSALGADPVREIENELGLAALIFLIASVACSPVKRLWSWTWAMRVRRELGLFAFFYAALHFGVYFWDQYPNWGVIPEDIAKRPFITVGFTALLLLVPLALTSTKNSIKRLGYLRWQQIHWLVYPAGILAAVHFIWRVKRDVSQPLTYAVILAVLLGFRVVWWLGRSRAARQR